MKRPGARARLCVCCLFTCALLPLPASIDVARGSSVVSGRGSSCNLRRILCSGSDVRACVTVRQDDDASDSFLQQVRQHVLDFKSRLPDFLVHQHITRFAPGWRGAWAELDTLDTEETYEAGKGQRSKLLKHNGRATDRDYAELRGALSFGVFSTALATLFQSKSATEFDKGTPKHFRGKQVVVYSFRVPLASSQLTLGVNGTGSSVHVAYQGSIWVDRESHQALKLEQATPKSDSEPLGLEKMVIEYDWVKIGDERLVLPVNAEIVLRHRVNTVTTYSRSVLKFSGYQRFAGEIRMAPAPPAGTSGAY
jgi:hypothetical protein